MKHKCIQYVVEAGYSLAFSWAVGKWAFWCAWLERGYEAVGSEYLITVLAACVSYKSIHYIFRVEEADVNGKGKRK